MAITSFTIGGVEVDPLLETFELRESTGSVSTLDCDVESFGSPVQRFALRAETIVQEDGVRIFAGNITQTHERGHGGPNLYDADTDAPDVISAITHEDYARIADRVFVSMAIADGTLLKDALTTLVTDWLAALGVSLDAAQVNGPALPAMIFTRTRASDVLQAFSDATNYVQRIDYDKKLRMWAEGDLVAPFDIDEADDPASWYDDVEVEKILGDNFANRVTIVSDPITEFGHTEHFVGDGVTDTFSLTYTPIHLYGVILVDSGGGETLDPTGTTDSDGNPTQWWYDAVTNSITRNLGAPALGDAYTLYFDGTFQAFAMAEDAASIAADGLYEWVEQHNEITDNVAAAAMAASVLATRLNGGDQIVTYQTRRSAPGLHVGQKQIIEAPSRNLSGPYIITELQVRGDVTELGMTVARTVTAKRAQPLQGKWQQTYHDWLSDSGGTASPPTSVGASGAGGSGPAAPDKAVQFNDGGVFGGSVNFTFDKNTKSLVCGDGGSSITAAAPESCQVFGYDCHITD